jgi:glutathione S-transferase
MSEILRLHGYPVSNYFNIARAALIEKGLRHEIVQARAAQDEPFLTISPMGKIPVLETGEGWISETVAILEYLDDRFEGISLRPPRLFDRARARQIINVIQVYVEGPARSLFPGVFFGGVNDPTLISAVRATLDRATVALRHLLSPAPFLMGEQLSAADLFSFYNLDIADRVSRFVYHRSIKEEVGGLTPWWTELLRRESSRTVLADFESCFVQYLHDKGAAYSVPARGSAHA